MRRRPRSSSAREVIAAGAVVAGLLALSAYAFLSPHKGPRTTRVVILVDASPTSRPETRCSDVTTLARHAGDGGEGEVSIILLSTGDGTTGGEPVVIERHAHTPSGRLAEGASIEEAAHASFLAEIRTSCERIAARQESPIYRGVAAAVRLLADKGCGEGQARCTVFARTDGLEEEDVIVKKALGGRAPTPRLARIGNEGINVTMCGLSERQVRKGARSPDPARIEAAVRPEFMSPERVAFLPSCAAIQ